MDFDARDSSETPTDLDMQESELMQLGPITTVPSMMRNTPKDKTIAAHRPYQFGLPPSSAVPLRPRNLVWDGALLRLAAIRAIYATLRRSRARWPKEGTADNRSA